MLAVTGFDPASTAWLGAIILLLGEVFALLPLIYDFYPV